MRWSDRKRPSSGPTHIFCAITAKVVEHSIEDVQEEPQSQNIAEKAAKRKSTMLDRIHLTQLKDNEQETA